MVFLAGVKLCDPCLNALKWFVYHARRYTGALLFYLLLINTKIYRFYHHLILTHQTKQQYQNRLCIDNITLTMFAKTRYYRRLLKEIK